MKLTYDPFADALYMYTDGNRKSTRKTEEVHSDLMVDFDDKGKLIGIEILKISDKLPKKSLQSINFEFNLEKPKHLLTT